jgi:hypothetical protein
MKVLKPHITMRNLPMNNIGIGREPMQQNLLPVRFSVQLPDSPISSDIAFVCDADDGHAYYCKGDKNGRRARATEWFAYSLARALEISVPESVVLERDGQYYFGSRSVFRCCQLYEIRNFLQTPQIDHSGRNDPWVGQFLSRLSVLDMFLHNVDRCPGNFVLQSAGNDTSTICAIDFADALLDELVGLKFPKPNTNTIKNGRIWRNIHGFDQNAAVEMVDRIASLPVSTILRSLSGMPDDWMTQTEQKTTCDIWDKKLLEPRLLALRLGIKNGNLL